MSDPTVRMSACASCGGLLQPEARFCPDCGTPITQNAATGGPSTNAAAPMPDRSRGQLLPDQLWGQPQDNDWAAGGYPPGQDPSGGPDLRNNDSRNGALFVAAALILVFGILVGSVLWFLGRAGSSQASSTPTTRVTSAAPATSAPTPTPTPTPSTASPSPSTSLPPVPPVTGQQSNCPQTAGTTGSWTHSVSGNPGTSCAFAEAVRAAFVSAGGGSDSRDLTVTSPVTNQAYPMRCDATASVVTCRGTENASIEVLIYP